MVKLFPVEEEFLAAQHQDQTIPVETLAELYPNFVMFEWCRGLVMGLRPLYETPEAQEIFILLYFMAKHANSINNDEFLGEAKLIEGFTPERTQLLNLFERKDEEFESFSVFTRKSEEDNFSFLSFLNTCRSFVITPFDVLNRAVPQASMVIPLLRNVYAVIILSKQHAGEELPYLSAERRVMLEREAKSVVQDMKAAVLNMLEAKESHA